MVVREDDDLDLEEATKHASILQNKQLITNNVINKRKEQLQRWESSEMNGEPVLRQKKARVKFEDSDIFLSACMSGDEDEVEELLAKGADINTATVDGLTALHQVFITTFVISALLFLFWAVIDSKPDMVRFLCEKGADVNAQDNEGWTPLHAAACCGNLAIVRYLCQSGALLSVINSDRELALDLADDESCREFLEHEYRKQGVIPEQCRDQELATMMRDVQQWIRDKEYCDKPHPRTGATAVHVAAAKGHTQLLELLIKAGGNVLARDKDGWTPLHAAAHWAEKDSCKILLEHGASITDTNFAGQNVLAVADKDVVEYLEDLERSVDKRKSPPTAPASILQEKNNRLSREEHTLTTDRKHEIQHKDQASENEMLRSLVTIRRLGDGKSPSPPSESPSLRGSVESEQRTPPAAVEDKSSAERSASEPPSLPKATTETFPTERIPSSIRSTVSAERSLPLSKPVELQRSGSGTPSLAESIKTSDGSSSSIHSGDQHVSATVPIPTRPLQQPNSWINRGVQLITRSGSSSASSIARSSATASSDSSSPMSLGTSSTSSGIQPGAGTPSVLPKPPAGIQFSRPWQSSAVTESEAERRNTARIQRQHRRSTQGVTKEHLEEASRIAMAEAARRRGQAASQTAPSNAISAPNPSRETVWHNKRKSSLVKKQLSRVLRDWHPKKGILRPCVLTGVLLASKEAHWRVLSSVIRVVFRKLEARKVTRSCCFGSTHKFYTFVSDRKPSEAMERTSWERAPPPANAVSSTAPLSLPSTTASNQAVVGIRRKSQGLSVSRSNRRGTGPVLAEDIHAAVSARQTPDTNVNSTSTRTTSVEPATTTVRPTVSVSSFARPLISSANIRTDVARGVETSASLDPSGHVTTTAPPTRTSSATVTVGRVQPRLPGQTIMNSSSFTAPTYTINARPTEMNLNYKALYEKEKTECERLRKELEEMKRSHDHNGSVSTLRTASSRFRNGSPATGPAPVVKSASGNSLDDNERRTMERKIADLEIQLKELDELNAANLQLRAENAAMMRVLAKLSQPVSRMFTRLSSVAWWRFELNLNSVSCVVNVACALSQLRMENQRLKEENGALVRVISKMTI
ncbi:ankyrin repeat protein [Necator americanus]|uniref:Ankyrin repeat protein n=1 Tax=Necator americanus TaxID=51031 RepID=W2T1A0_NECAM|nr:ankyrin repeat protein [Necator americanus]ETN75688.1 ankyrin repeat protein [Necator americanus]